MSNTVPSGFLDPLVQSIKKERDPLIAIGSLTDVVVEVRREQKVANTEILDAIDEIKIPLLGDGEPEKSLIVTVNRQGRCLVWILRVLSFIGLTVGGWVLAEILGLI